MRLSKKEEDKAGKRKANRNRKRISRYHQERKLHSRLVRTKGRRRRLKELLHDCAKQIKDNYFIDDLKAPMNNKAKPAFFSKPSVNIYFGNNQKENGLVVSRASCGFGSGKASIGLDPRTMRIHSPFGKSLDLTDLVTRAVKEEKAWAERMKGRCFNCCSIKVHYKCKDQNNNNVSKTTEWHVDVTMDKEGVPKTNNSQVPGTPVAILTFGEEKALYMRRHSTKELYDHDSLLEFRQESGSFFVLDGRDEEMHESDGKHWRHMSKFLPTSNDGVTFSFMFRAVQMETEVHKEDDTLVDKHVTAGKLKQYQQGVEQFTTEHYCCQRLMLDGKMDKLFVDFKP